MANEFTPHKAEKKRVKLKMAIQGPSGSGKTLGALALAKNLWTDAKVCVVDTENESASLYADQFDFDTIPLTAPFFTKRYTDCIDAVIKAGYDVLILDSITPQWDGEGGILQRKNEMDMRGGNGYANWLTFTPEHERFKQKIQQSPIHIIATMRSKQEYALQANDKGKTVPVKMGLAPVQRDGFDYEFTLVFDVQQNHFATASKDRTGIFNGLTVNIASPETATSIREWLDRGTLVQESHQPAGAPATQQTAQSATQPPPAEHSQPQSQVGQLKFIAPNGLITVIKGVKEIAAQPAEGQRGASKTYMIVNFLGQHNGVGFASCFDTKYWDLLEESIGLECHFQIKEADKGGSHFINIVDVIYVDGQEYKDGKPVTA